MDTGSASLAVSAGQSDTFADNVYLLRCDLGGILKALLDAWTELRSCSGDPLAMSFPHLLCLHLTGILLRSFTGGTAHKTKFATSMSYIKKHVERVIAAQAARHLCLRLMIL